MQKHPHPNADGTKSPETKSAEIVLNSVINELENLRQRVTQELNQDIDRLQSEKIQLSHDITDLRKEYDRLQSQQLSMFSQKAIAQQQLWLKQLSQALASNLYEQLTSKISELSITHQPTETVAILGPELPAINPIVISSKTTDEFQTILNNSLHRILEDLQAELNTYQSQITQQLQSMRSMEQQGEVILNDLVERLKQELNNQSQNPAVTNILPSVNTPSVNTPPVNNTESSNLPSPVAPAPTPQMATPAALKPTPNNNDSQMVTLGLVLAFVSAVVLSIFNVCLKIILKSQNPKVILGAFPVEGLITPGFGNSLLILCLRMTVIVFVMPILAKVFGPMLYPNIVPDLKKFFQEKDFALWSKVFGSAFFLFVSQVLIYVALGNIPAGVAITIFFIYPIITVLGAWKLFGDRPTKIRLMAMCGITLGLVLAGQPSFGKAAFGDPVLGIFAAIGAGVTFAGYVLLTQMAAGKLHPIPFSLVSFYAIFVFSAVSLIILPFGLNIGLIPEKLAVNLSGEVWGGLIIAGVVLGILTLFSYLLNNFAIRYAGAARSSIIAALGPALTAIFAWIIIQENLLPVQIVGMLVVILSVAAISAERLFAPK